eukprot:4186128-Prymnesium_polylepis.2
MCLKGLRACRVGFCCRGGARAEGRARRGARGGARAEGHRWLATQREAGTSAALHEFLDKMLS